MKFFALACLLLALLGAAWGLRDPICRQPHSVVGRCRLYIPSWSFNSATKECVSFIYGGCGGNMNNFYSLDQCKDECNAKA